MRSRLPALAAVAMLALVGGIDRPAGEAAPAIAAHSGIQSARRPSSGAAPIPADASGIQSARRPSAHSFYFSRVAYGGGGWGRRWGRGSWATDFPEAEHHFLVVLQRVTRIDAYARENVVRLDDPDVRRYPFLYAVEVGQMGLSDDEVEGLRAYLLAGGFLMVDDFWGSYEWAVFEHNMRRVFPDREIVDVPRDHAIFNTYYRIDGPMQVPGIGNVRRNRYLGTDYTAERDGHTPYVRGIFADDGRLMVVINYNTDLADAWEHADEHVYPLKYSTYAYEMAINQIVYAMSR